MVETSSRETLGFQTEVRQLLNLMIHSLYSNKEIFLRELISNASDAADKLRFEALAAPELFEDDPELSISIEADKSNQTLTIVDNGIGMSREEIVEHLGTIARSGTAEFLQRMTGDEKKDAKLIGQFGVGFYSAFIVARKVVVETRRAGLSTDAAVRWESDGQGEFSVEPIERSERGTAVTLYLKPDEIEFAEPFRIESLIRKYSDHIAFPVSLVDKSDKESERRVVNEATALWTRPRSEIDDDEYREFYKHLSHDYSDPLSWSHNRVEGKRDYTSLLYVPATAPFDIWNREAPRGLKLYVQRVFIMDDADQFLPLYLRFVRGVVDSSDLPLNVSRELLQQNPELSGMRSALARRVLDMLEKMARKSPEDYQAFWKAFGQVLKEGLIEDYANREKITGLLRFATTYTGSPDQDQSLNEYVERAGADQDKIYYVLSDTHATAASSPHIEKLADKGVEVILLSDRIDGWVVEHLTEYDGKTFQDVARADIEFPEGGGKITQEAVDAEHKPLLKKIKQALKERVESVQVSQRLVDSPACVVVAGHEVNPQLRRMLEASGQSIPEARPVLEINIGHPLVSRLERETDQKRFSTLAEVLLDHALLAEGSQLKNPSEYVKRMNSLMLELDSGNGSG